MSQKHVAIVDGAWVGHHPSYVRIFAKTLLEAGYRVSVFCPSPDEVTGCFNCNDSLGVDELTAYYFIDLDNSTILKHWPERIRKAVISIPQWLHMASAFKSKFNSKNAPDIIFFAWADIYLKGYLPCWLLDKIFPFSWSGLFFHPRHLRRNNPSRRGRFIHPREEFLANSSYASSIAVLDEGIADLMQSKLSGKKVITLPDFTDETPAADINHIASDIRERARGRKVIGLLGDLARRKGLLTLIRMAAQYTKNDWYFVIVGRLHEGTFSTDELTEIKSFIDSQRDNCYVRLGFIESEAQFNALIDVCDAIFAIYVNFPHSSNLLTKAAQFRKRVLVSTGGYMEEVVKRYYLGEAVSEGDVMSGLEVLERWFATPISQEELAGMAEYAKRQSLTTLRKTFLELIGDAINAKLATASPNQHS